MDAQEELEVVDEDSESPSARAGCTQDDDAGQDKYKKRMVR
jgi:hypothetical protein